MSNIRLFVGTKKGAFMLTSNEKREKCRSGDGGQTWQELSGLRNVKRNLWQPGAGGMCLHNIILDPNNPK